LQKCLTFIIPRRFKVEGRILVRATFLMAVIGSAVVPVLWSAPAFGAPPAGFSDKLVASGLDLPVAMEFAPDGRLFVSEKDGAIRIVKDGELLPQPFATLDANSEGERGVQGIAFDPNFSSNGYVYVYYTTGAEPVHNRVSRLTADPANLDRMLAGSERAILDLEPLVTVSHNGGALEFGPDGRLYVSTGDNYHPHLAQSLTSRLGKILRINADGTIPTDNPFYRVSGAYREIWATGLRNPFSFTLSQDGKMHINDVGQDAWEEINEGARGANYGWPLCEGRCSQPDLVDPVYAYQHPADDSGSSVAGGAFYEASQFPAEYRGSYFFGDYARGFIKMLTPDNQEMDFISDINSPVDVEVGPEGHLYYLSIGAGEVRRVQFTTAGNYEPVAAASADQTSGQAPLAVHFDGSQSTDRNNDSLSYAWDFGDGSDATGAQATHTYDTNGPYVATLTVNDGKGGTSTDMIEIMVGIPPTGEIEAPSTGARYDAGDVIAFRGSATDGEGATTELPASAFEWRIDFHHNTHTHPFREFSGMRSGTFEIPTVGETADDVWYRVYLTVTDPSGLTHQSTRDIRPNTSEITLSSNVTGIEISLDGQPRATPHSFVGVVGAERTIEAPETQVIDGLMYNFQSWSDGGQDPVRTIATPAGDATLEALYSGGTAASQNVLSISSADMSGNEREGHYVTVEYPRGTVLQDGYTPLDFEGYEGMRYTVIIRDYRNATFDRWEDDSVSRVRTVAMDGDMDITAHYRTVGGMVEEPPAAPPVTYNLTVSAADLEGRAIPGPYVIVESPDDGTVMSEGPTPLTYTSTAGNTYRVVLQDVGDLVFDSWQDGSTERARTVSLDSDVRITALYRQATLEPEPPAPGPQTGGSSGSGGGGSSGGSSGGGGGGGNGGSSGSGGGSGGGGGGGAAGGNTFPEGYFESNPLDRIQLQEIGILESNSGQQASEVQAGEQIDITTSFRNYQQSEQGYAMIIQIEDPDGFTADIGWVTGNLESGETTDVSRSWTAPGQGQYTVEMFAWDGVDQAPAPLSEIAEEAIDVG
jgi:glucose/arabinose dehydrogenase